MVREEAVVGIVLGIGLSSVLIELLLKGLFPVLLGLVLVFCRCGVGQRGVERWGVTRLLLVVVFLVV
jgi:hypothetical protein